MKKYLVLDIGGTTIKYALMNCKAEILQKNEIPTPLDCLDDLVKTITQLYEEVKNNISGIAISMPGIIEPQTGFCYTGGALKYIKNINLAHILEKHLSVPVSIGNDAKCAANAEIGFGNLKDVDDAVVIILGTAIGGCLVKDHKVIYGKNLMAGEFSFIQVNGLESHFDFSNTWANYNGVQALLNIVQNTLETNKIYSGKEIFEMANNGNKKVLEAIRIFARRIAFQILNLQAIFDPERFVIGGGISAQSLLIEMINSEIELLIEQCPVYFPVPHIKACKYRNDSNLIGALYQHIIKFNE